MGPAPAKVKTTRTPRDSLVWVALGMAVVALATAIYLTTQSTTARDLFVYRITLLLVFFAISTVSAVVFHTRASLGGNLWGMTLALGGPAVLWIVALVIFTKFYPEAELQKEVSLQSKAQQFWGDLQKAGWQDYDAWKAGNGDDFGDILGSNETDTLRNLFWNVYYRSPGQRLNDVQIATVFLYFGPKYTMKFQRIRGNREPTRSEAFELHYGGQTSNSTGTSGSVLLVGRNNESLQLKDSYYDGESSPQQSLDHSDIDCLIVSWYDDEVTSDGDYLTADMKEFATNHRANFRLGIAAFQPIEDVRSWSLNFRTVTDQDNLLPLRFLPMSRQTWHRDLEAVAGDLKPWLEILDRAMASENVLKGKPRAALQKAMQNASQIAGHPVKAVDLLKSPVFKDYRSASMPEAEDVVLTMFLWHTN